jgi:hypothetical protein
MERGLTDTSPDAEAVQLELLRQAGPSRRGAMALELSRHVCGLSQRAIRKANPGVSEEELAALFVDAHYGAALGAAVRADLARRRT